MIRRIKNYKIILIHVVLEQDDGNMRLPKEILKNSQNKKQILRQKADDSIFMNYVDCRGNIEFEKIFVDAGILVFALARVKGKRRIRWRDRKSEIRNIFVLVDWDRSRESGENS